MLIFSREDEHKKACLIYIVVLIENIITINEKCKNKYKNKDVYLFHLLRK